VGNEVYRTLDNIKLDFLLNLSSVNTKRKDGVQASRRLNTASGNTTDNFVATIAEANEVLRHTDEVV
jgi:hypothetical protein